MLPSISQPGQQTPRPYVRFELRPREDRTDGKTTFVDEAWAVITAAGSRDTTEILAEDWVNRLKMHARENRVPPSWPSEYAQALAEWRSGQTMDVIGTPLKLWPAITPAQLKSCEAINVLTVEALAEANMEALGRIGMGAMALKASASTWLQERSGNGALASKVNDLLQRLEASEARVQELLALIPEKKAA